MSKAPACPLCHSRKTWKDGLRYLKDGGAVQRWLCRSCGYRFSDPSKILKENCTIASKRQVGAAEFKFPAAKNLAPTCVGRLLQKVEKKEAAGLRGPTKNSEAESKILAFLWQLKKDGRKDLTIRDYGYKLRKIAANADIFDPESVKAWLCRTEWSEKTKQLVVTVYDSFLKWLGKSWKPPTYKPVRKLPFIPTESELDQLIASCGRKLAAFLQLLKETGARCGEAIRLEWTDIDFQRKLVKITPEKGSNPRLLPISDKLIGMLQKLPKKSVRVWPSTLTSLKTNFYTQRKKAVAKLNNPRLMKISLHTFRHWKATMEYHRTKDILHVQQMLGHRDIKSTMIYITLEQAIFNTSNEEFHVKTAKNAEEAAKLLQVGFEYVCTTPEGIMLFRKRK